MNLKIKNIFLCMILSLLFISSTCYASTNYRYLTSEEIDNYTKFEITDYNRQNIETTPIVNAEEKVYDFADILTDSEEVEIKNKIDEFIAATNFDLAVVTLAQNTANDYFDRVFADDFYDYNDFGKDMEYRSGICLLIDIRNDVSGNRYVYISTTGNAILSYDDARISDIVDDIIIGFQNSSSSELNYFDGVIRGINTLKFYEELGIPSSNLDAYIDENGDYQYEAGRYRRSLPWQDKLVQGLGWDIVIAFVVMLIFNGINSSKLKNVSIATNAKDYLKEESIKFTNSKDDFLSTYTSSYKIESSSSGGGSSTHHSSSGGSHGGGGGHF